MTINICLVGYGYWGNKLARNIHNNTNFYLYSICERNEARRKTAGQNYPDATLHASIEPIVGDKNVDAFVLATPSQSHTPLAQCILENGHHLLVEKPIATTSLEAEMLFDTAENNKCKLIVDHTFLFSGAVQTIKQLIDDNQLGVLTYFDTTRINLGFFQPDIDVLWDLAVHDLSILQYLFDNQDPDHIVATGYSHLNPGIPDMAYITMHYANHRLAHIHVSWMSPVKTRKLTIAGKNKMLVWNDLNLMEPVKVYDRGIKVNGSAHQDSHLILPEYRLGDFHAPHVNKQEPLDRLLDHFAMCCRDEIKDSPIGRRPVLKVLNLLEKIAGVIKKNMET